MDSVLFAENNPNRQPPIWTSVWTLGRRNGKDIRRDDEKWIVM